MPDLRLLIEDSTELKQEQKRLALYCKEYFEQHGKFPKNHVERLWKTIYPFVCKYSFNKSIKMNHQTAEDLQQVSFEAMCKAIEKYNPAKTDNFFNYCILWIVAYVRTENMKNISAFKYGSRKSRKMFNKLSKYSHLPMEEQVQILGISREEIDAFVQSTKIPKSILKKNADNSSSEEEREEYLTSEIPDPEVLLSFKELFEKIMVIFADFQKELVSDREKEIFSLLTRVGNPDKGKIVPAEDGLPQTYSELAEKFGVTKERIRQIACGLKDKLRKRFEKNGINEKAYHSFI